MAAYQFIRNIVNGIKSGKHPVAADTVRRVFPIVIVSAAAGYQTSVILYIFSAVSVIIIRFCSCRSVSIFTAAFLTSVFFLTAVPLIAAFLIAVFLIRVFLKKNYNNGYSVNMDGEERMDYPGMRIWTADEEAGTVIASFAGTEEGYPQGVYVIDSKDGNARQIFSGEGVYADTIDGYSYYSCQDTLPPFRRKKQRPFLPLRRLSKSSFPDSPSALLHPC